MINTTCVLPADKSLSVSDPGFVTERGQDITTTAMDMSEVFLGVKEPLDP